MVKKKKSIKKAVKKTAKKVKKVVKKIGKKIALKEPKHTILKVLVRSLYNIQKLRIELGNRISAANRLENKTLHDDVKDYLQIHYDGLDEIENDIKKDIGIQLEKYPIWSNFLKKQKGIGPTMGGVIVSEIIDILRFDTVSKLWSYIGYGIKDGQIQKRKKGVKSNWNQFLKSKLYVVGEGFLRSKNPKYRKLYEDYKNRIQTRKCPNDPKSHGGPKKIDKFGCTKGHRHAMAMRYMIKSFLLDLYLAWYECEGKKPRPSYQEEYLGHTHKVA